MTDKRKHVRIMIVEKREIMRVVEKTRKTESAQVYVLECVNLHTCQAPNFGQTEKNVYHIDM
jgi:hypothetical protein